jgi:hypothetical protein
MKTIVLAFLCGLSLIPLGAWAVYKAYRIRKGLW